MEKLRELNMDFNDLFILECFLYKEDKQFFEMFTIPSLKDFNLSTRFQYLKKNEYLVENPSDISKLMISVKGEDLLLELKTNTDSVNIGNNMSSKIVLLDFSKTPEEKFEEWWKTYPTNGTWTTDDKLTKFISSRNMKNLRKPIAKERYLKLLNQGLKHEDLIGALKYEIKLRKLDSIKKKENQMEYFKGMESYLNQSKYMDYIDLYKQNVQFTESEDKLNSKNTKNVTDI